MNERSQWGFLLSRRWIAYWSMLVIFSITCVILGNWQFQRRAEAQAEISRIDANYFADPIPLSSALPQREVFDEEELKWQPVEAIGTYLEDDQLLVRNRPRASEVGYEILAPLKLRDGSIFIVNRGWIPLQNDVALMDALPELPVGEVRVVARLKAGEPVIDGRISTEDTVGTIFLPEIASRLDGSLYEGAYGLLESESPASQTGALAPIPERDEGPHLSYALQWFVFIGIAVAGTIFGARMEHRSLYPNSSSVLAAYDRQRKRKTRKGNTDADDEDALLDAQESSNSRSS